MASQSPSAADVDAAAKRMQGKIHRTPLLESIALNNLAGCRVLVKAEALQKARVCPLLYLVIDVWAVDPKSLLLAPVCSYPLVHVGSRETGTFKFRGALNRVLLLPSEAKARGVVAFSSGNFGQGLAAAATLCGVKSTIVMPGDAPLNKQARARSYGATVVLSDILEGENREITAARLAEKLSTDHGYTLLHPFEDRDVIAGQGTTAVELADQAYEQFGLHNLDAFLVCAGGGGLSAGCCLALEQRMPLCARFAVEPAAYDDHARSFASGSVCEVVGNPVSICDALQAASPGKNTWPVNKRLLTGVLTVTDDEVRYAMRVAFETLQLVLEPSGAVPLAAVLARKVETVGKTVAVVASGGNTDVVKFAKTLGLSANGPVAPAPPNAFDWTGFQVTETHGLARPLLAIRCLSGGCLGCGWFDMETANKVGESLAVVNGVSAPHDMLGAVVAKCSEKAIAIGINEGMLGRRALEIMRKYGQQSLAKL